MHRLLTHAFTVAVAQFFVQFCFKTRLHEFPYGLLEQFLDVIHAAYVCHLQQLPYFLSSCQLFRASVSLPCHMNTSNAAFLFYTALEVYTTFGTVSKAIIAVARKLLYLLYTLLSRGMFYSPPVPAIKAV